MVQEGGGGTTNVALPGCTPGAGFARWLHHSYTRKRILGARSWKPGSPTSVGLYLNSPENAVVVGVDEKSQALDRTQPILPLRPGLPEKATHDYVRHGTSTLCRGPTGRHRAGH
jgi:hypothetical protein